MEEKKTYVITLLGEAVASWEVELTEKEAELVKRVLDIKQGKNVIDEDWSPTVLFGEVVPEENPKPEEKPAKKKQHESKDLTYSLSALLKDVKVG